MWRHCLDWRPSVQDKKKEKKKCHLRKRRRGRKERRRRRMVRSRVNPTPFHFSCFSFILNRGDGSPGHRCPPIFCFLHFKFSERTYIQCYPAKGHLPTSSYWLPFQLGRWGLDDTKYSALLLTYNTMKYLWNIKWPLENFQMGQLCPLRIQT